MKKILIIYASQTGVTADIATTLHQRLIEKLPETELRLESVRDIAPEVLLEYPIVLFGSSTWDHGIPAPDGEEFLQKLTMAKPDLSAINFALFGIGDSAYPAFCEALPLMQSDIELCQGKVDPNFFTIDGFADNQIMDDLVAWSMQFIEKH
jgi:flavodoxin I